MPPARIRLRVLFHNLELLATIFAVCICIGVIRTPAGQNCAAGLLAAGWQILLWGTLTLAAGTWIARQWIAARAEHMHSHFYELADGGTAYIGRDGVEILPRSDLPSAPRQPQAEPAPVSHPLTMNHWRRGEPEISSVDVQQYQERLDKEKKETELILALLWHSMDRQPEKGGAKLILGYRELKGTGISARKRTRAIEVLRAHGWVTGDGAGEKNYIAGWSNIAKLYAAINRRGQEMLFPLPTPPDGDLGNSWEQGEERNNGTTEQEQGEETE